MLHPLQWEAAELPCDKLTPIDIESLETVAEMVPYGDEIDERIVTSICRDFLEAYTIDSDSRPFFKETRRGRNTLGGPVRFCIKSFGVIYEPDTVAQLHIPANTAVASAGWLIGLCTPEEPKIKDILDDVRMDYMLECQDERAPELLNRGLWAEICLKPPATEYFYYIAPKMFCPIPGTLLFNFSPVKD